MEGGMKMEQEREGCKRGSGEATARHSAQAQPS